MSTKDNQKKTDDVKKLKETVDGETRYYLPLEADLEWVKQFGYTKADYVHVKVGYEKIRCIRIPTTKEQYDEYIKPINAKAQADWRAKKCMVPSEKTGKLVRCKKPCKDCPFMKNGAPLSLDRFVDEDGYEQHDHTINEEASTLTSLLFCNLMGKLKEEAPELAVVFSGLFDGKSQRKLERSMGIPHSTMTGKVAEMRKILQRYVTREDIFG